MRPLLIAKTGATRPDIARRHGDFEDWFTRGLGLSSTEIRVIDAQHAASLPAPDELSGIVITGSHAMVTDRAPWSERLAAWLADSAMPARLPILGVCYGHQLLAHALGGEIDYHPDGPEVGTVPVQLTPAARSDPLLGWLPGAFHAHATHAQTVRRLPPGAVHLARNDYEPHHAFRIGDHAWGLQFHPEFDAPTMRAYAKVRMERGECPACDWPAVLAGVRETPESAGVLRSFAQLARSTRR